MMISLASATKCQLAEGTLLFSEFSLSPLGDVGFCEERGSERLSNSLSVTRWGDPGLFGVEQDMLSTMYPDDDTPIEQLMNLGPASGRWLHPVGIRTFGDLQGVPLGVLYEQVKRRVPRCNSNFLYAVQGALMNLHANALPPEIRRQLRFGARVVNQKLKRERQLERERHSVQP
jgi:DNA transformation protein